ncbi:MAG: DUF2007 domain-containing protein [Candidatus Rokubacteria bacterium]|nr:DUF2007 domain-containing protein [Candidatus Rokubacteria bacterium]
MERRGKVIRFPKLPSEPRDDRGLVEVCRCDQAEAVVVRSLLESEGIPTLLRSRLAHSVHPFTVGDQGEVVILVPASEAERARRLLVRMG